MEAGQRIIKQKSTGNDLVASGRITFPPTHCCHLEAAMSSSWLVAEPLLGKKRNEDERMKLKKRREIC